MRDGSMIRAVVWNDGEARPRAVWRLGLGVLVLLVGGVGGVLAASTVADIPPDGASAALTSLIVVGAQLLQVAGFVAAILAAAWLVDRRELTDLGLGHSREWWADLAFGLALGVALPALVFGLELAAGFLRVTGTFVTGSEASLGIAPGIPVALALALTFGYFVGVGVFEELLFRGYLLTNVAEGLDGWRGTDTRTALAVAGLLSSVAFGIGHGLNPNVTPLALLNITLYGGLFAASYLLTERIAVAIGAHVTWNFSIASVFGFPVSGFTTPVTVVAVSQSGPSLVTGGSFGPEGGLVALFALLAGSGALVGWVRLRERAVRWRPAVGRPSLRDDGTETNQGTGDGDA